MQSIADHAVTPSTFEDLLPPLAVAYLVGHSTDLQLLQSAAERLRALVIGVATAHEAIDDTMSLADAAVWHADRLIECDAVVFVGDWIDRPEACQITALAGVLGKRVVAFETIAAA